MSLLDGILSLQRYIIHTHTYSGSTWTDNMDSIRNKSNKNV